MKQSNLLQKRVLCISALIAAVTLAILLRTWRLNASPDIQWDEPIYIFIAKNIVQHGLLYAKPSLGTAQPFFYHPPLFLILLGLWLQIFGNAMVQARVFSVIVSATILPGIFLFLKNKNAALLTAFLVAMDPWINFSNRLTMIDNMLIVLGLYTLLFFQKNEETGKERYTILTGIFLGLTLLTKFTGIVFFIIMITHHLIKWHSKTKRKSDILLILVISLSLVAPYLIWTYSINFTEFLRQQLVQLTRLPEQFAPLILNSIMKQLSFLLSSLSFFSGTISICLLGAYAFITDVLQKLKKGKEFPNPLLASWCITSFIFLSFLSFRYPHYFMTLLMPLFLYASLFIVKRFGTFSLILPNFCDRCGRAFNGYIVFCKHCTRLANIVVRNKTKLIFFLLIVGLLITQNMGATYFRFSATDNAYRDTITFANEKIPKTSVIITEDSIGNAIQQPYINFYSVEIKSIADLNKYNITYAITLESYTYKPHFSYLQFFEQIQRFQGVWYNMTIYKLSPQQTQTTFAPEFQNDNGLSTNAILSTANFQRTDFNSQRRRLFN